MAQYVVFIRIFFVEKRLFFLKFLYSIVNYVIKPLPFVAITTTQHTGTAISVNFFIRALKILPISTLYASHTQG